MAPPLCPRFMSAAKPDRFTIWGSRGSVAVSNPESTRYGGHTTCLEFETEHARVLIDAGTGLVEMLRQRGGETKPTLLLVSHLHWDHIVGFPFYAPLFRPGWDLDVRGVPRAGKSVFEALLSVNQPPIFPLDLGGLIAANVRSEDLPEHGSASFHGIDIAWTEVWHPGGCSAFRLSAGGRSVVFTGDVELPFTDRAALTEFTEGADTLICDAQYSAEQYERHVRWGHSSNIDAARFAADAGVDRLILTHHDPMHDDEAIDRLVEQAREVFPRVDAARHGMHVIGS